MLKQVRHDDIQQIQHDVGKISLAWQKRNSHSGIRKTRHPGIRKTCHPEFISGSLIGPTSGIRQMLKQVQHDKIQQVQHDDIQPVQHGKKGIATVE